MQNLEGLNFRHLKNIFNLQHSKTAILKAEEEGRIPRADRVKMGASNKTQRVWDYEKVSQIGEKYGFLKRPSKPTAITVFSTKGGILKSTICLNIARMYALHNVKTVIVDLDPQADSSNNLGLDLSEDNYDDLSAVDTALDAIGGLYDVKTDGVLIEDIIQETDIPSLDFIPATSELIPLMDLLNAEVKREYWLQDNVVEPLKQMGYELIILDLAPSWSIYTSNALTTSDLLISPLETKIAHYRNHKKFIEHLKNFTEKMKLEDQLEFLFVPVKHSGTRKLSTQIKQYYFNHIKECSSVSIRESITGEESVAQRLSVIEYAYNKTLSEDIREFLIEVNAIISKTPKQAVHSVH